jgi:hypothetical protein
MRECVIGKLHTVRFLLLLQLQATRILHFISQATCEVATSLDSFITRRADKGTAYIPNVAIRLSSDAASYPRRTESSHSNNLAQFLLHAQASLTRLILVNVNLQMSS